ncbi:MAG: DUF554 domain-containing protein [Bacillota bacterium]|nr:DUF554 domain-containing protein [Bacillota bacterium]
MDIFIGVLANAAMVIVGSVIGSLFKSETLKRMGERIFHVFAIFVLCMGINGAADISDPVKALICMIVGVAIGELIDIDKQFTRLGNWAETKFSKSGGGSSDSKFAEGFVSASLLFCIGSMTFMGALESGVSHQHTIYLTKGVIDGISSITLAMGCGMGVALSAGSILIYQGILTLLASLLSGVLTTEAVAMASAIGSLFLVGIGLNMLGITKLKVANFLPAMFMPLIWQAIENII